jgi:capsular exopolysaccharide synthesis family protein
VAAEYEKLITIANPRSPISEAYRTLRTNVQFSSLDRPLKTLLVTSASPEEGKSTTLANLAVTFAQAGSEVILVDSDLRRPSLHKLFGLPNERGLTSYMLADPDDAPPVQSTGIERLRILTSGLLPHNPSDLLGSQRFEKVIATLTAMADVVFFDCPPVAVVADAAVLGRKVDGCLLVVSAGTTRRDFALRAKRLLDKASVPVIGTVLNNAKVDASLYSYYE